MTDDRRRPCASYPQFAALAALTCFLALQLMLAKSVVHGSQATPLDIQVVSLEHLQLEAPMYLWDGAQQSPVTEAYRVVLRVEPIYFIRTDTDFGPQIFMDNTPVSVMDANAATNSVTGYIQFLAPVSELWYTIPPFRAPLEDLDANAALSGFKQAGLVPAQVNVAQFLEDSRRIVSVTGSRKQMGDETVYEVVLEVRNFTEENFQDAFFAPEPTTKPPDVVVGTLVGSNTAFSEADQTISADFSELPGEGDPVKLRYRHYYIPAPEPFPGIP
jgi:hypothetical protein